MKKKLHSIILLICTLVIASASAQTTNDIRSKGSGFYTNIGVSVQPNITAAIDGTGKVTGFTVNSGGTFSLASGTVNVYCTGGGGNGGYGTATLVGNTITTIALGNGGSGYTTVPTVVAAANSATIWEKWNGSAWADVTLGTAATSSAPTITIQSGHIVTLTTTGVSSCNNLTIESGAQLNTIPTASTGATATIRVGGTAPATAVITNNGIFGSAGGVNDGIIMEPNTTCASLTLTGSGATIISRIRPTPPNVNSLVFNIDQDITLNYNLASFTAYYNSASNTAAENVTYNINAGKVVTITQPNGGFHGASTNLQGNVTYNINGTIDLSLTGTSNLIGSTNAGNTSNSKTTFNVGATGKIITGTGLVINTVGGGTTAPVYFNVASGGIIDGTKLTTLTNATTPNSFVLSGTAQFIRTAATGVATTFPVSTSVTKYNPVILNNSGTSRVFTVTGLQNPITTPTPPSFGHIDTKWNITPATAVDGAVSVQLGWQTADQGTFDNAGISPSVIIYDSSNWVAASTNAVTGTGTVADPYIETGSFSTFGDFSVGNTASTLPLNLISFNASLTTTGFAKQVNLSWKTEKEIDAKDFEVQRSEDGKTFTTIAIVNSQNIEGSHDYASQDKSPLSGTSYYRLKQNDLSGGFKYSNIKSVKNSSDIIVSIYPNPVSNILNIAHPIAKFGATVKITNSEAKSVLSQEIAVGSTSTSVDLASVAPGIYIVIIENGLEKNTIKFIKK